MNDFYFNARDHVLVEYGDYPFVVGREELIKCLNKHKWIQKGPNIVGDQIWQEPDVFADPMAKVCKSIETFYAGIMLGECHERRLTEAEFGNLPYFKPYGETDINGYVIGNEWRLGEPGSKYPIKWEREYRLELDYEKGGQTHIYHDVVGADELDSTIDIIREDPDNEYLQTICAIRVLPGEMCGDFAEVAFDSYGNVAEEIIYSRDFRMHRDADAAFKKEIIRYS